MEGGRVFRPYSENSVYPVGWSVFCLSTTTARTARLGSVVSFRLRWRCSIRPPDRAVRFFIAFSPVT